jgi:hypothetical protein
VADKMPTKFKYSFQIFFCLLFFEGTFTISLQRKKAKMKSQQNSKKSRFFLRFCLLMEGSGSGSGGPKTFGSTTLRQGINDKG